MEESKVATSGMALSEVATSDEMTSGMATRGRATSGVTVSVYCCCTEPILWQLTSCSKKTKRKPSTETENASLKREIMEMQRVQENEAAAKEKVERLQLIKVAMSGHKKNNQKRPKLSSMEKRRNKNIRRNRDTMLRLGIELKPGELEVPTTDDDDDEKRTCIHEGKSDSDCSDDSVALHGTLPNSTRDPSSDDDDSNDDDDDASTSTDILGVTKERKSKDGTIELLVTWNKGNQKSWEPEKLVMIDYPELIESFRKNIMASGRTMIKDNAQFQCKVDHSMILLFKEEDITSYWNEGEHRFGVVCEVCGGETKPVAKRFPSYCCSNPMCSVTVCNKCFCSYNSQSTSRRTRK